jgi:ABC-type nitrate/sulfonate/bicarbonate transport system substrate-binding protein
MPRRNHRLRIAAACAALALPAVLAACGDEDSTSNTGTTGASASAETQEVTLQLDWTPNTNHTGFYVADEKGYYADAGIKLKILPYSDAAADTIVGAGKADCGITFQDNLPVAVAAGTNEVSVMPIVQHQVNALIVRDKSDFKSPKDLAGATYGGFGLPFEEAVVNQMIKSDGGTGGVKVATLNAAAYEAVYNGDVDTSLAFETWELIEAAERGVKLRTFDVDKYGVPDTYNVLLACNGDWLKENPELADKFVQATAKGFEDAVADPQAGAQTLIDANPGVFSNEAIVQKSSEMLASEYYTDDNGNFGCQTAERWVSYPKWLYENDILLDPQGKPLAEEPDYESYYTNEFAPEACAS